MSPLRPALLVALLLAACTPNQAPPASATTPAAPAVARVNGQPITAFQIKLGLATGTSHSDAAGPDLNKAVLQTLVRQELRAQEAARLGLQPTPAELANIEGLEARLATLRRTAMAEAWYRSEVLGKAEVSEAEARAHYEANKTALSTRYHVQQILRRDRKALEADKARLDAGEDYDVVAASRFGELPASLGKPWDLGWLRFSQFPPAWRGAVDTLEPGGISDILDGGGDRHWIVRLVAAEPDPTATFAALETGLREQLKGQIVQEMAQEKDAALKAAARLEIDEAALSAVQLPSPEEEEE